MTNPFISKLINHPHYVKLCELLAPAELRLVGGCVRDAVLGIEAEELDMATTITPDIVMKRLQAASVNVKPTGIEFGTVTAILEGCPYEITTLRRDMECDGRHVKVVYSEDWAEDAARRDFTCNAMSLNSAGEIADFYNGMSDALSGIIRFVGEPAERIREDYLRVLRYFRFYARYGKVPMDVSTLKACGEAASNMDGLSGERVQKEMFKILASANAAPVLQAMEDCGVLAVMIPSLQADAAKQCALKIEREKKYASFIDNHSSAVGLRRLAYLLYQPVLSLTPINTRWKLSKAQFKTLQLYCSQPHGTLKNLVRRKGKSITWDVLLVQGSDEELDQAKTWLPDFNPPQFPLTGDAVMAVKKIEGATLGEWLKTAEERWEESGYALTEEELFNLP